MRLKVRSLVGLLPLCAVTVMSPDLIQEYPRVAERILQRLSARGILCRRLHTSHAFHSAAMDPVLEPFQEQVR